MAVNQAAAEMRPLPRHVFTVGKLGALCITHDSLRPAVMIGALDVFASAVCRLPRRLAEPRTIFTPSGAESSNSSEPCRAKRPLHKSQSASSSYPHDETNRLRQGRGLAWTDCGLEDFVLTGTACAIRSLLYC